MRVKAVKSTWKHNVAFLFIDGKLTEEQGNVIISFSNRTKSRQIFWHSGFWTPSELCAVMFDTVWLYFLTSYCMQELKGSDGSTWCLSCCEQWGPVRIQKQHSINSISLYQSLGKQLKCPEQRWFYYQAGKSTFPSCHLEELLSVVLLLEANLSPWPGLIGCEKQRRVPWVHVEPPLGNVFVVWSISGETTAIPLDAWKAAAVWKRTRVAGKKTSALSLPAIAVRRGLT